MRSLIPLKVNPASVPTVKSCAIVMEKGSSQDDIQHLVTSGTMVFAASIIGNGLNYAFGMFLARTLGAPTFGLYALGLTLFNILTMVAIFGMDIGAIKFVSHYLGLRNKVEAAQTVYQTAVITFISGLLAGLGLALFSRIISINIYNKPSLTAILLCFSVAIPFYAVNTVLFTSMQAYQSVKAMVSIRHIWEPVGKFVLAGVFLWAGLGLQGVVIAITLTLVVSAAAAIKVLFSVTQFILHWNNKFFTWEAMRRLLKYCSPLAISTLFGIVAPRTDILILGYWVGIEQVGIYQAAFQTAAALALILGAFEMALTPLFGRLHANNDFYRLEQAYQAASRVVVTGTTPIFIILVVFSPELLAFFGKEFAAGVPVLIILSIGQLLSSGAGSPNNMLLMSGHSLLVMWNAIINGVVLIFILWMVIPYWGMTGAAVGAASVQILLTGVRVLQVWKLHNIQPFTYSLLKPMAAGLTSTIVLLSLKNGIPHLFWPVLGIMALFLYLGTLLILKPNQQDLQAFYALFNRLRPIKVAEIIPEANGR